MYCQKDITHIHKEHALEQFFDIFICSLVVTVDDDGDGDDDERGW